MPLALYYEAGCGPAFDDDLADPERLSTRHNLSLLAVAPQGEFVVQGQEGDVGEGQHGTVGLLRRLLAFPQPWPEVVVKGDLHPLGPTQGQLLQQAGTIGEGEDGEADTAQIEPVNVLQLLAD
ncbi:hypothetical protein D3C84_1008520 [compost metagenome]